jgi:hypothetical protein
MWKEIIMGIEDELLLTEAEIKAITGISGWNESDVAKAAQLKLLQFLDRKGEIINRETFKLEIPWIRWVSWRTVIDRDRHGSQDK